MLLNKNQAIDLGGIAKGYIADKIIEFYKSKGGFFCPYKSWRQYKNIRIKR